MSRLHPLTLPLARADVDQLRAGDRVLLSGPISMSIGLPTHQRMVDLVERGEPLPIDLRNAAFVHLSCYNRDGAEGPEALYMNPTTSTRYNAFMPRLIEGCGLRLVGGKGGLNAASVAAMQRQGCAYVSFLGGGCTPLSKAIRRVRSVHWPEYIEQFRLLTLEVEALGPATVAIDAHGVSLYEILRDQAAQRLPAIEQRLEAARDEATVSASILAALSPTTPARR